LFAWLSSAAPRWAGVGLPAGPHPPSYAAGPRTGPALSAFPGPRGFARFPGGDRTPRRGPLIWSGLWPRVPHLRDERKKKTCWSSSAGRAADGPRRLDPGRRPWNRAGHRGTTCPYWESPERRLGQSRPRAALFRAYSKPRITLQPPRSGPSMGYFSAICPRAYKPEGTLQKSLPCTR
jgi:hypothetical protein